MENKIKVHLKQLMPSLVGSADILASKSEGLSTAEEAYKQIKDQVKIQVKNSMMKSHYLCVIVATTTSLEKKWILM